MLLTARLPDGRSVEYAEVGNPAGPAVLFCHGTPQTADGTARLLAAQAGESGARVVIPSRPGYGDSSPSAPGLTAVAEDLLALADLLGIGRFGVVGSSGGGPFALATPVVAPDRVTGVGILAGAGPFTEITPPTDEDAAERAAISRYVDGDTEGGIAALTESAAREFGPMLGLEVAELNAALSENRPASDTWFRENHGGSLVLSADLQRALARPDGYVRDVLSWGGRWDVDLAQVRARVRLVYGEDDVAVPPVHGEWVRDRLTGASEVSFAVVPGGHADVAFGNFLPAVEYVRG